jgi:hypothetical protein
VIRSFSPWFAGWARDGAAGEGFGDYCTRVGMDALLVMSAG